MTYIELSTACIDNLPDNAIQFIKLFMRMEFALKETGYIKPNQQKAEPHWDRYANDLGDGFFRFIDEGSHGATIINKPPSIQIVQSSRIGWKDATSPLQNTQDLFISIRRIRNNLLHGGKSGERDSDRNDVLINEAIYILTYALHRSEDVKNSFQGLY